MSRVKTGAAGAQETLVWELWVWVEGGLEREGSLFTYNWWQCLAYQWLLLWHFSNKMWKSICVGMARLVTENAVPQKLFHGNRGSLSSCPCTKGLDPTIHRLLPPPMATAFQWCLTLTILWFCAWKESQELLQDGRHWTYVKWWCPGKRRLPEAWSGEVQGSVVVIENRCGREERGATVFTY